MNEDKKKETPAIKDLKRVPTPKKFINKSYKNKSKILINHFIFG